jgi:hypothetical protein
MLKIFKVKNLYCVKCPVSEDKIDVEWCVRGCGMGRIIDKETLNCGWFRFERSLR